MARLWTGGTAKPDWPKPRRKTPVTVGGKPELLTGVNEHESSRDISREIHSRQKSEGRQSIRQQQQQQQKKHDDSEMERSLRPPAIGPACLEVVNTQPSALCLHTTQHAISIRRLISIGDLLKRQARKKTHSGSTPKGSRNVDHPSVYRNPFHFTVKRSKTARGKKKDIITTARNKSR